MHWCPVDYSGGPIFKHRSPHCTRPPGGSSCPEFTQQLSMFYFGGIAPAQNCVGIIVSLMLLFFGRWVRWRHFGLISSVSSSSAACSFAVSFLNIKLGENELMILQFWNKKRFSIFFRKTTASKTNPFICINCIWSLELCKYSVYRAGSPIIQKFKIRKTTIREDARFNEWIPLTLTGVESTFVVSMNRCISLTEKRVWNGGSRRSFSDWPGIWQHRETIARCQHAFSAPTPQLQLMVGSYCTTRYLKCQHQHVAFQTMLLSIGQISGCWSFWNFKMLPSRWVTESRFETFTAPKLTWNATSWLKIQKERFQWFLNCRTRQVSVQNFKIPWAGSGPSWYPTQCKEHFSKG